MKNTLKRIPVSEAARRLGVPEQAVRTGVDQGVLPIGYATGKRKKTYYIFEDFLERYVNGK